MNSQEIMKALAEPFAASDIEWRLQHTNSEKTSGLAVPYIDSRAIQNRLDDVAGGFNWQNAFTEWHDGSQLCGISIYCEDRQGWVTKFDGAPNTDIEPVKGGLSDSFKRAAVQWSIGRYLYSMDSVWVDVEQRGRTAVIKKDQQKKLDDAHAKTVKQIFGSDAEKPTLPAPKSQQPRTAKPENPPIGAEDKIKPFPSLYTVTAAKTSNGGNGVSTMLDMTDPQGNPVRAYLRGENPAIKSGAKIKDLSLTEKTSSHGPYFIVDKYEIAA